MKHGLFADSGESISFPPRLACAMRAKQRYVLVIVSCAFLILCYFGGYKVKMVHQDIQTSELNYISDEELENVVASDYKSRYRERCTMESCFNFSLCHNGFKVYVYPIAENLPVTLTYQKILNSIYSSKYYTKNVTEACLFVLNIDTLDRDILSNDYVRDIELYINALEHWNGGENHIIFNLYSGTWPDYFEDLGFNTGKAILAKASMAEETYRYNFDVSIPLIHKEHPEVGGDVMPYYSSHLPDTKTYLLGFKGKRYVYGIGSETRNALYHIHNQRDVVAVTTCRHGKSWKDMKDERCDADNAEYDRFDYDVLIQNSSYCLVPRGRRLGSFRFVEVIQFGCIPVILSNGWKLPFFEVIDWTKAAVWGDERLLFQVPELVRSIDPMQAFNMRQNSQLLWHLYFSSIDRIVHTTLEIVRERVDRLVSRTSTVWNVAPGALLTLDGFSGQLFEVGNKFTAIIVCHTSESVSSVSRLYKLVQSIGQSKFADTIVVLWRESVRLPFKRQWPRLKPGVKLEVKKISDLSNEAKFSRNLSIRTKAIFSFNENVSISTDEIDFAFNVWSSFPARIVGFDSRSHFWDDFKNRWYISGKWLNEYSLVFLNAAIYHTYYIDLYWNWLGEDLRQEARGIAGCEEVLLNMVASHITRKPPVKVTQRRLFDELPAKDRSEISSLSACYHRLTILFGYNPLLRSEVRMDPVLYKDPVSNLRKKYKDIELANP